MSPVGHNTWTLQLVPKSQYDYERLSSFFAPLLSEQYEAHIFDLFLNTKIHGGNPLYLRALSDSNHWIGILIGMTFMPYHKTARRYLLLDCLHREFDPDRPLGYISMIGIVDSEQKRGVGTSLLNKAIEFMKDFNCQKVFFETVQSNETMIGFGSKFGFEIIDKLPNFYRNGIDAVRMFLTL
ncbi:MAG: N-alpha-acetyltransferase 30 [Marteilia pararefringens]